MRAPVHEAGVQVLSEWRRPMREASTQTEAEDVVQVGARQGADYEKKNEEVRPPHRGGSPGPSYSMEGRFLKRAGGHLTGPPLIEE